MNSVIQIVERHWNTAPVDIYAIIREAGIELRESSLQSPNDSGMIERIGGSRFRITVNEAHPEVRKRFTAAHELGHYVYHRDLIGDGILDNAVYRSAESGRYANTSVQPRHESQANRFAANVLMPRHLIAKVIEEGKISLPLEIWKLSFRLKVSEQALKIRLGYS